MSVMRLAGIGVPARYVTWANGRIEHFGLALASGPTGIKCSACGDLVIA